MEALQGIDRVVEEVVEEEEVEGEEVEEDLEEGEDLVVHLEELLEEEFMVGIEGF